MSIFKRVCSIVFVTAFLICITANASAKADAPDVLDDIIAGDLTSIQYAYESLTSEQMLIVEYLVGAYNNIYLCARGFSYNIDHTESAVKAQFKALGNRVITFLFTRNGWGSRVNETFRQYLSSCIVYAQEQGSSITFDDWFNRIKFGGTETLYIPYSAEAFDAWTTFYNDPTNDGIASFGEIVSDWDCGNFYDFGFTGYIWRSGESTYNQFLIDHAPVIYTNVYDGGTYKDQFVFGPQINGEVMDSLFITRTLNQYCFGIGNNLVTTQTSIQVGYIPLSSNRLSFSVYNSGYLLTRGIENHTESSLADMIEYAFDRTPYHDGFGDKYRFYYPFIQHVYLVDDLTNLTNLEEIFNVDGLDVNGSPSPYFIVAPNGRLLLPAWPYADDDPMDFWDNIVDNSVDLDFNPVSEDDFSTRIINNTTINNYYVTNGDPINVPVDWFQNDYSTDLYTDSTQFFNFVNDTINSLGDLKKYMYGSLVFGLAGGIIKKLLL